MVNKEKIYDELTNELGCPLDVVFKAIKDGIVIKAHKDQHDSYDITLWLNTKQLIAVKDIKQLYFEEPRLIKYDVWCFSCSSGSYSGCVSLKDYKKTWWLSSDLEEKEND